MANQMIFVFIFLFQCIKPASRVMFHQPARMLDRKIRFVNVRWVGAFD